MANTVHIARRGLVVRQLRPEASMYQPSGTRKKNEYAKSIQQSAI